jgi:hypothetical protein
MVFMLQFPEVMNTGVVEADGRGTFPLAPLEAHMPVTAERDTKRAVKLCDFLASYVPRKGAVSDAPGGVVELLQVLRV